MDKRNFSKKKTKKNTHTHTKNFAPTEPSCIFLFFLGFYFYLVLISIRVPKHVFSKKLIMAREVFNPNFYWYDCFERVLFFSVLGFVSVLFLLDFFRKELWPLQILFVHTSKHVFYMCVCVCVCTFKYMRVHACIHTPSLSLYLSFSFILSLFLSLSLNIYIYVYIYSHECTSIFINVCFQWHALNLMCARTHFTPLIYIYIL